MNPGLKLLANKSFRLHLYDCHLEGVSVKELADFYVLPETWVEERIEATRLCLKFQVQLSFSKTPKVTVSDLLSRCA
jgi:hypothetical protein